MHKHAHTHDEFLPRDPMQRRLMPSCGVRSSVCPSVYHVREFCFFPIPNVMAIFRRGPPTGGFKCMDGRQKSRFSNSWLSKITGVVRTTTTTFSNASVNLCLSQRAAWMTTTKRTEQILFVRSSKSEVEITNNRRLRSIVLLKLTDRHEASRGLSATAGPLV